MGVVGMGSSSSKTGKYPLLFAPIRIGGATMRNRVALAPMTVCFGERDGTVTERQVEFLEARAAGGVGMVMTEGAAVSAIGRGWDHHFCAYDDRYVDGLSRIATAVQRHGALAWLQLMHTGRRTPSSVIGAQPVSATGRRSPGGSWEVPRRLSTDEVYEVIDEFVAAIVRGARAGFDGVELHGGHAYLINQFLSPGKNDRDDEFGRDTGGRTRFATEIIRRAHANLGDDYPIGVRLSLVEFEPNGIAIEDTQEIVQILERAGAAYIDGSAGVSTLTRELHWTTGTGEATLSEYAAKVRPLLGIPYMTVGRILRPETAERVLRERTADIIGLGRALIADPQWLVKAREERPFMICIGCNGCQQRAEHRQSGCPVNPQAGHEYEYRPAPAAQRRRVLVINSGVGGIEAALQAARRGHDVRLACVGLPFGGLLGLRARIPGNEEVAEAVSEFARLCAEARIDVQSYESFDEAAHGVWDAVIDASPGPELELQVPWPACTLESALQGRGKLGHRIAVVGQSFAAVEAGISLAGNGHDVVVVGEAKRFATDTHPQLAHRALERLSARGGRVESGVRWMDLAARSRTALVADEFDSAVVALGWGPGLRGALAAPPPEGRDYRHVGDTWNPWDLRFVAERGMAFGATI